MMRGPLSEPTKEDMPSVAHAAGAAKRRRERRLRQFLRHERLTVAMLLAESQNHAAPRGQNKARSGGSSCTTRPSSGSASPPGGRPAPLSEVAGWQDRVKRHVIEDLGTVCPYVQILDLPVPHVVENVTDTLRFLDLPIAEQVIEVPKISCSPCPSRSPFPEPQSAEQLVEVPTVLSPTCIALQIAEQIVDTPVPGGRGQGRVQGFLPRQSSTATPSAEERISERIVEQFSPSSAKRTSERIEEQLVGTSPGVGLGQGSSSSAGPADGDFTGGFSHFFPWEKKCACRRESECGAAPGGQLMDSGGLCCAQWFG